MQGRSRNDPQSGEPDQAIGMAGGESDHLDLFADGDPVQGLNLQVPIRSTFLLHAGPLPVPAVRDLLARYNFRPRFASHPALPSPPAGATAGDRFLDPPDPASSPFDPPGRSGELVAAARAADQVAPGVERAGTAPSFEPCELGSTEGAMDQSGVHHHLMPGAAAPAAAPGSEAPRPRGRMGK